MEYDPTEVLISRCYREAHSANIARSFDKFLIGSCESGTTAALGYRCAGQGPLFLEVYLDEAVESAVSRSLGSEVERSEIVELGNFAAANGMAMVDLWGRAANDLGSVSLVAVATLTAPLRAMFHRIGLPIMELAPARAEAVAGAGQEWGRYYAQDPRVCAGMIAEGQQALARYFARRSARRAA